MCAKFLGSRMIISGQYQSLMASSTCASLIVRNADSTVTSVITITITASTFISSARVAELAPHDAIFRFHLLERECQWRACG